MAEAVADKPHAVCIPFPAQSHIKALMKLAKLLHYKGFHITFVNTEFNQKRLLKSRGSNYRDGSPDFQFQTIPDGLPFSDSEATQDARLLLDSIQNNFLSPFLHLLAELNDSASPNVPPVTCIIADGLMTFTITAAEQLGIPIALFDPIAACAFMGFSHYHSLLEKGLAPLKDESYLTNGYLDTIIDWIPGMKNISLKDLPSFLRTTDPNDILFTYTMEATQRASKASAIIIQTFDVLESNVLEALSSMFPSVYAIGPLQLLLNQTSAATAEEEHLKFIGYNLWKEEAVCLQWLNSKETNSVIYVNFGSVVGITTQQLIEFGWGLANSKHYFLWVIRPDLVGGTTILPPEFVAETKERCLITSWCPQEQVLNHPAVGGFLTHCGWNSTIESLSAGVPMLCWPVQGDQQTNCKYICTEWEIGLEIDSNVKRDEVEKFVRELLEGVQSKKMRNKVMEWKKMAEEATGPQGSSSLNLDKLINQVLLSRK